MPLIKRIFSRAMLAGATGAALAADAIDLAHLSEKEVALAEVSKPGSAG